MLRRSEKIKSKQLKLEEDQRTVEDNNDEPKNVTGATKDNAGADTEENYEESSSSSGALDILDPRKNPLQNPVILQHLFRICPAPTIAACRRVNKLWYAESLQTWRTTFPFPITSTTSLEKFQEISSEPGNQLRTKPYRNLSFSEFNFHLNSEEFGPFWKSIGSNLHTLTLYRCSFNNIEEFRQLIYKSCPLLQKLYIHILQFSLHNQDASNQEEDNALEYKEPLYGEHQHLRYLNIAGICRGTALPVSWIELFSHFPLLVSFKVYYVRGAEFDMLMDAIKIVRSKDGNKLPFKSFQIFPYLTISPDSESRRKCDVVQELRLPLSECNIQVGPKLDQSFLKNTLAYLAGSIDTIVLKRGSGRKEDPGIIPTWFQDFPFQIQLDKLAKLESQNGVLENFLFLKYTPNIDTFDSQLHWISDQKCGAVITSISDTCKEELSNVKVLRLSTLMFQSYMEDADILHLFKWMPNITDLEIMLSNDEQFGMVCENWKNLRNLEVFGHRLTTEGITEMEKVKKAKEVVGGVILPRIANLKDLQVLTFRQASPAIINFTPESVCHLFLHLPSLQRLSLNDHSVERGVVEVASYQRAIKGSNSIFHYTVMGVLSIINKITRGWLSYFNCELIERLRNRLVQMNILDYNLEEWIRDNPTIGPFGEAT